MPERGWSALFFLDEAVALTAGHRPCHYCRRDAYHAFRDAWAEGVADGADRMAMDTALHRARVTRTRKQVRHDANLDTLPDGAFVLLGATPHLVQGNHLLPFAPGGYAAPIPRHSATETVLTPRPMVEVLRAGFTPILHPTTHL